jgi:predicted permease
MKAKRLALVLFVLGILFFALYGLVLSFLAVIMQFILVISAWKKNPQLKYPAKLTVAASLCLSGILCFVAAFFAYFDTPFGYGNQDSMETVVIIGAGTVPFIIGGIIMFTLPTRAK